MTEDELVMLEQMCDAATPGPWVADEYEEGLDDPTGLVYVWARDSWPCLADCDCAPFIAAAREWLPKLVDKVRQLAVQNELLGHCVTGFELLLTNPDLTDDERWAQMIEHQKQIPQGEDMYSVLMCKMEDNQAEVRRLREALQEISIGRGPYSRDPLTHADNTIDAMKAVALGALDGTWKADDD